MKSYAFISSILAGAKMRDCNQFDTIRYIFLPLLLHLAGSRKLDRPNKV